jgi:hypothetical protein
MRPSSGAGRPAHFLPHNAATLWAGVGALCMECVMALCEITACKYETRDSRGFAVATAANGSR